MTGLQAAIVSGSALIVIIALLRAALRRHLPARLFPALWTDGGYSYALNISEGLSRSDIAALVAEIQ